MIRTRSSFFSCHLLILLSLLLVALAPATEAKNSQRPTPARVLLTLDLPAELAWFTMTDTGSLVAYAGNTLQIVDLLASPGSPTVLEIAGLDQRASVVPIPATGLLLVPDAPGTDPGSARRSLAIDTLAGKVLWTGPSLGTLRQLEFFADQGLAVLQTWKDGWTAVAVDLASVRVLWQKEKARLIWSTGGSLGLFTDAVLTVDPRSGKVLGRAPLELGKKEHLYSFLVGDGVLLVRKGRKFRGLGYPVDMGPATPGQPAAFSLKELWRFRAAAPMLEGCFKNGFCRLIRPGPGRLLVRSGHYELLDVRTGKVLWDRKRGMLRTTDIAYSPEGRLAAVAAPKGLEVIDLVKGRVIHEIPYPENLSGLKMSKQAHFIDDEIAMTVFPDKKGEPRGLTAFSCERGKALWAVELPRAARYNLTSKEQSRLFGRIAFSLIATAVSASNAMSYGGSSYALVFVPDIDVRQLPGRVDARSRAGDGSSLLERAFPRALERYARLAPRLLQRRQSARYYVTGPKGEYEILRIDLRTGDLSTAARYAASPVHAIYTDSGFERAISLENDKRRLKLLSVEAAPQSP